MSNTWKFAMMGVAITTVTALTSSITTAYFMRPVESGPARAANAAVTGDVVSPSPEADPMSQPRRGVATYVRETRHAVGSRPAPVPRLRTVAASTSAAPAPAATDCATGGDRAMRIAKPGALGALLGAGLGAVGGAIAGGGKGAGKGALIGGVTGVAAGAAYGAYKTKNECGTILGKSGATTAMPEGTAISQPVQQAPLIGASTGQPIEVYRVR